MKVLIYGGTTEGRQLAEMLQKTALKPVVCVATDYGSEVMEEADPQIEVRTGRLNIQQMHDLAVSDRFCAVVDATHPFAREASRNIKASLDCTGIALLRLSRETEGSPSYYFRTAEDCALALRETDGNILLTTGSSGLGIFCQDPSLRSRIVARVLPGDESLSKCRQAGLTGRQIIAMQGPFSEEMNLAVIHQYDIRVMVTKESGHTGGTDEKISAAAAAGIPCYVIRRPAEQAEDTYHSVSEVLGKLSDMTGTDLTGDIPDLPASASDKPERGEDGHGTSSERDPDRADQRRESSFGPGSQEISGIRVILAGIGMGSRQTMTGELMEALAGADYLFGAKRMILSVQAYAAHCRDRFFEFSPEAVIPIIRRIARESRHAKIVILFSGDSGFQSGASSMRAALEAAGFVPEQITALPGISCLSYLSSGCGISWEDAAVISLHGVPEDIWKKKLSEAMRQSGKIFFLTSGVKDVRSLGRFLQESGHETARVILGYQLSYPEQRIETLTPEQCADASGEGLYCGFILHDQSSAAGSCLRTQDGSEKGRDTDSSRYGRAAGLTHGIPDTEFIRGNVPMTKEEIRELVICRLQLRKGSVLYDIGSGTGSVAIEASLIPGMGRVYAFERDPDAVRLIRENTEKFGSPVRIVQGTAPETFSECGTDVPTHAFIGGAGGKLEPVIASLRNYNSRVRVVMTAVTLETIRQAQEAFDRFGITDAQTVSVSVSRAQKAGAYHLMKASNMVYIFTFDI